MADCVGGLMVNSLEDVGQAPCFIVYLCMLKKLRDGRTSGVCIQAV